jgi:hypothetical protein
LKTNMRHLLYNLALIACLIAKQLGSIIDLALSHPKVAKNMLKCPVNKGSSLLLVSTLNLGLFGLCRTVLMIFSH